MIADRLQRLEATDESHALARRLSRVGWWVVLASIVPLGLWMVLAPLSMAVFAPGFVRVDLNRRPVQHREGGIVQRVVVRDGQHVRAGDPILYLGDVSVDADRNRLSYRMFVEKAALARHEAEQLRASALTFAPKMQAEAKRDERVREALEKETRLFDARRDALVSEMSLLDRQQERVQQEVIALEAQIRQARAAQKLQQNELDSNRKLVNQGFISPIRLGQIEAFVKDYAGKIEERRSELARAHQRMVETRLKSQAIQNEYARTASDELKGTAARLGEIEQELRKTEDAAARQLVPAPTEGEVIDLKVTSPGAVVQPGDTIAEIVPTRADLLVEAHIRTEDVNNVNVGQRARVRFTAHKYRNTLLAEGEVTYVSGDRLVDPATGLPYYNVHVQIPADALKKAGDVQLQAGMPAEVFIQGTSQTPLQYILEPITSTFRKAGRQL